MVRILNRVIEWTDRGIEYEADQRHAEIIARDAKISQSTKSVNTPGIKSASTLEEINLSKLLNPADGTLYRAIAARANYLSQDRSDIQFAVKELSRKMSNPNELDWLKIKRLAQYLTRVPRVVVKFNYQKHVSNITVWSDADWAGSGPGGSRMSTSGGVLMLGSHVIKHWATTQHTFALSSGESEYYALVKSASQSIGLQSMQNDINISHLGIEIKTDASAAIGIASRRGLGRVRHIEVAQLWIQEKVAQGKRN